MHEDPIAIAKAPKKHAEYAAAHQQENSRSDQDWIGQPAQGTSQPSTQQTLPACHGRVVKVWGVPKAISRTRAKGHNVGRTAKPDDCNVNNAEPGRGGDFQIAASLERNTLGYCPGSFQNRRNNPR